MLCAPRDKLHFKRHSCPDLDFIAADDGDDQTFSPVPVFDERKEKAKFLIEGNGIDLEKLRAA